MKRKRRREIGEKERLERKGEKREEKRRREEEEDRNKEKTFTTHRHFHAYPLLTIRNYCVLVGTWCNWYLVKPINLI